MKLTDIRIGAPLLRIKTRIFHATPRKPTAFERVILSMSEKFGNDVSFNKIPLERLFVDILCVVDPGPLVTPTLSELAALDVIRCIGDIEALDTLVLSDIEITERGKRMISEDMLPAKSMQNDETYYYDPIRQQLLSESESKAYRLDDPPKLSIDASVFEDIFPEEQIRGHIHRAGYRWFSAASHIERLEPQSVQILWKDTPCAIEVNSGVLTITSEDENLSSYLSALESEDSYNRFIFPVFESHNLHPEAMPILDIENLDHSAIETFPVSQVLSKWPDRVRFVIPGLDHVDNVIPEQAPPHQAIIVYHEDAAAENLFFEWNQERNGCKLKIKGEHPFPDSLQVTDQENLRCHRIQVKHGNETRQLLVVCHIPVSREDEFLKEPLRRLSALTNEIAGKGDMKAAVLWEGESQYLENQLRSPRASQLPVDELVTEFYSVLVDSERIKGNVNRNVTGSLWEILDERISGLDEIEITVCMKLLQALSMHGPHAGNKISKLLQALTERIKPPHTLDALEKIRSVFRVLDPSWSSEFPSSLYTAELVKSTLESFPKDLNPQLITDDNSFFRPLASLLDLYEKISNGVGDSGLDWLNNDEDYVHLIKSKTGAGLADLSHEWASDMDTLLAVLQGYSAVLDGTYLASINCKVAEIANWTAKLVDSIDDRIHSVYVFDTSALIAQPQIVADIRPNEMFVVTKRVIEELDDKKLDESLRPSVSEVVRNLRNIRKEQIQFCDGDMSLLPSDYRLKGDNLILSVAVRFRKHNPVLITNDNNLSLKAQAEGIAAMEAEAFVGRPRSRAQYKKKSNREHSQNPRSNQGKKRRKR